MKTYVAQRPIDHNNQVFEENTTIDLDDSAAKPLIAVGAVVEKLVEIAAKSPEGQEGSDDSAGKAADNPTQESTSASGAVEESAAINLEAAAVSDDQAQVSASVSDATESAGDTAEKAEKKTKKAK